jgi:hypothetical protein
MGFLLVVLHQMVLLVAREGLLCKCIFWLPEALLCVVIAIQMGCVLSYLCCLCLVGRVGLVLWLCIELCRLHLRDPFLG